MFLIVGLGNPGKEYEKTRHNVGFRMVDFLRKEWDFPAWKEDKVRKALLSRGAYGAHDVLLAKPQMFMNASGEAVSKLLRFYKVPLSRLLAIYDDLDLPFGTIRFRKEGSAGTHNGMRSIIGVLGKEFARLRIGIETRKGRVPETTAFVLSKFIPNETAQLDDIFAKGKGAIELHFSSISVE